MNKAVSQLPPVSCNTAKANTAPHSAGLTPCALHAWRTVLAAYKVTDGWHQSASLFCSLSTKAYLEAHVLVQSVSYGCTSGILQAIPSQIEVMQRHIVHQALG